MKSYTAYFVRTEDTDTLNAVFRSPQAIEGTPWFLADYEPDAEPPEDAILEGDEMLLGEQFAPFAEAFVVYGDFSVDGFVYEHSIEGEIVRKLSWFPTGDDGTPGWIYAAGEPEAWEATLFRQDQLDFVLNAARYHYERVGNLDALPEQEAEIRTFFAAGKIVAGNTFPPADGTCAMLVEESFGINRF